MNEQYDLLYKQHEEIIQFAYQELVIYVRGYRNLQNSGKATDMDLNLFRLLYCSLFSMLENAVIIRENIRACDEKSIIEERYSFRRMLVSIYEMNKHLFGVNEKTEKKSLWNVTRKTLELFDAKVCEEIDKEIDSFKNQFVNNKTKDSRGIFEHYSKDPKAFEKEMEGLAADVRNVYMPKFMSIISNIVVIVIRYINSDINLGVFIDNSLDIDNEPESYPNVALENQHQILMKVCDKQVDWFSTFDTIYNISDVLSKIVNGQPDNKARLEEDFNELEFICSQIQRDILYAQLSVSMSESRVEQLLNVRYIFRHLHEGFKQIYGYTPNSQDVNSYWSRLIRPYICGITDEKIIAEFNKIDSLLKRYSSTDISDEKKRAVLTHIRMNMKKQDDYIPELMDWCQSSSLFTELDYLSDFYNIMNEMSGFVRDFRNVVMATYK